MQAAVLVLPRLPHAGLYLLVVMPMVAGFAALSWHLVEKPVLGQRRRFSFAARRRAAAPASDACPRARPRRPVAPGRAGPLRSSGTTPERRPPACRAIAACARSGAASHFVLETGGSRAHRTPRGSACVAETVGTGWFARKDKVSMSDQKQLVVVSRPSPA